MGDDLQADGQAWKLLSRIAELRSPWLTVVAERFETPEGGTVDSWRIEKPDSVVVLAQADGRLLLPPPSYRAGVGRVTLDFAGGRVESGDSVLGAAVRHAVRELGLVDASAVDDVELLDDAGWDVDSSTSGQRLFGAVATLGPRPGEAVRSGILSYPADGEGVAELLADLKCLQCRAVLAEWWQRARR